MPDDPVHSTPPDSADPAGFPNRRPLWELLALAGPTVAQMASYTLMQFIDTWMLARVNDGVEAPTAAGNGGLLAFAVISFTNNWIYVVFAALGAWIGTYATMKYLRWRSALRPPRPRALPVAG